MNQLTVELKNTASDFKSRVEMGRVRVPFFDEVLSNLTLFHPPRNPRAKMFQCLSTILFGFHRP